MLNQQFEDAWKRWGDDGSGALTDSDIEQIALHAGERVASTARVQRAKAWAEDP